MENHEIASIVEAMLFVAGEPVAVMDIAKALDTPFTQVSEAIDLMAEEMNRQRRGIIIKRFGEHVQLSTRAEFAPYVERLLQPVQKQSLSQSALETLAVIAYRQPVTKLEIEQVRGVKCDYSVQSLLNKGLIADMGRKEAVGRPILYGTTDAFLSHFGLRTLEDLPKPPDEEQPAEELDVLGS
ncbi:MAG: SMC-Scp complex subunit ScpB [Clostridia bacterium]|nr:SMC-Scp complex subunit ScpB [Clostridia bacterium]